MSAGRSLAAASDAAGYERERTLAVGVRKSGASGRGAGGHSACGSGDGGGRVEAASVAAGDH